MAGITRAFNNTSAVDLEDLKRYPKPRPSFNETESSEKVFEFIKNKKYNVFHLYGMSGSGKSQIIAAVCSKLDDDPGRIIWHVQCQPNSDILKSEWLAFAKALQLTGLISPDEMVDVRRELMVAGEHEIKSFINRLNKLKLGSPILFAIEDVGNDEKDMVKNLIDAMMSVTGETMNVQVLLATRKRDFFYVEDDLDAMDSYETVKIDGFTEKEAVQFLDYRGLKTSDEAKRACLAKEFAYSPLRLLVTKSYCRKYHVSYEEYYDSLGKDENIVKKERELLKEHSDLGANHGYDVIMKLLTPANDDDDGEKVVHFNVLKMMSFLNHTHVPTQLLENFIHEIANNRTSNRKNAGTYLIEMLRTELDANVWERRDYSLLSIHADILRAVDASMDDEERREVLIHVVLTLASLLDKDNRMKKNYTLLFDLKHHAERVALHARDYFDTVVGASEWQTKDYELLLGLSRLNEMIGFAISQHPGFREGNEEDAHFHRALDCIWIIVCSQTGSSFLPSWLTRRKGKKEKILQLIYYDEGKDPQETAKKVFKKMKDASSSKDEVRNILIKDWKRTFPIRQSHVVDMENKLGRNAGIDWDKMKKDLEENGQLSDAQLANLVKKQMVINHKQLLDIYLAERMASILHSRGRQDNYKGDIISEEQKRRCVWYAELGFQLCHSMFQESGIKSSFHYILRANNKLPRLTQTQEKESDEKFLTRINTARETALELRREDADFHEHGIFKLISGTAWTTMSALKYSVKVNTKVHKRPAVLKQFPCSKADKECEELYELTKAYEDTIMIATTCMIHCGKYYAARKEYQKGLEVFEHALASGLHGKIQMNSTSYAWALYNYGRAILEASVELQNRDKYAKEFVRMANGVKMADNTPAKWRNQLDDLEAKLKPVVVTISPRND